MSIRPASGVLDRTSRQRRGIQRSIERTSMKRITTYIGLALLAFAGSALDSQGLAGWISIAGVLAAFGLIGVGIREDEKAEKKSRQLKKAA